MKKILALFSSLFIFMGVKAQTAPAVKKETTKPLTVKTMNADTIKATTNGTVLKQNSKVIKVDHIKKTPTVQMKELPEVNKPHKG